MDIIKENYNRYYASSRCSGACCFCYFTAIVTLIVPFFLAFTTDNFWIIQKQGFEQPIINYQQGYMMNVFTDKKQLFSTNIPEIQSVQKTTLNNPIVSVLPIFRSKKDLEEDNEKYDSGYYDDRQKEQENKVDKFKIQLQFQHDSQQIKSVSALIFLRTQFKEHINLAFQSYIHVNINSVNGLSDAYVIGDIEFIQKTPIYAGQIQRQKYDYPAYQDQYNQTITDLLQIIDNNSDRNETLRFNYKTIVMPGSLEVTRCNIEIEAFVPQFTTVQYVPLISETMKFAWSQYFCFLFTFFIVGRFFMRYFYRTRVLSTSVKNDLPKKQQTFNKRKLD